MRHTGHGSATTTRAFGNTAIASFGCWLSRKPPPYKGGGMRKRAMVEDVQRLHVQHP